MKGGLGSFPLHAKTAKLGRFPWLAVAQGLGQFVIGSGAEFIGHVVKGAEIGAAEECQSFETFEAFEREGESPV